MASRMSRLIWFRVTAFPIRRLTAKANRLCGSSPGNLLITSQWLLTDRPDRLTSLIRLLFLKRFLCSSILRTDDRLSRRFASPDSDVAIGDGGSELGC
jgi:hypothetical protein